MNTAIITAAGGGIRSGLKTNKNLFFFDGSTVIEKTVSAFLAVEKIDRIIVTAPADEIDAFKKLLLPLSEKITVTEGGDTRMQSIKLALELVSDGIVLIHDGARPFVSKELIEKCLYRSIIGNNCIPTTPLTDTVATTQNSLITSTARENLVAVQTPQCFKAEEIKRAYSLKKDDEFFTDDCGLYCKYIGKCEYIEGEITNIKLTYKKDFENLLPQKAGTGYDLHKLVESRKLILGGVDIPHTKGLLGHSDADCVLHALMDAMLSACGLKDIGYYFPDNDDKFKDISSVVLLNKVLEMIKKCGYKPVNASVCIIAERPKLTPYREEIVASLSKLLSCKPENIGVSFTTSEGVGLIGREEAIACQCYVLLKGVID